MIDTQKMSAAPQMAPALVPVKKKRYEWIDNARIIAAFLIMMVHLPCEQGTAGWQIVAFCKSFAAMGTYNGRVPFFLILAGYFLARNITWKKAWNRFVWLLIPFVIWNAIYAFGVLHHELTIRNLCIDLIGLNNIFHSGAISIFGAEYGGYPVIGPSWFLRDIMVLSLLTPIIIRFEKWIPCVIVVMTALMFLQRAPITSTLLGPTTVYYYLLGVAMVRYRLDDAYRILNRSFLPFFVLGVSAALLCVCFMYVFNMYEVFGMSFEKFFATSFGMVYGALIIAYCGVLIEKLLPRFSKCLAPLGPACFLVFMLHNPIYAMLRHLCPCLFDGVVALAVPIPVFIVIVTFFLGMKRYTPFLMPYLGHMKITKPAAK